MTRVNDRVPRKDNVLLADIKSTNLYALSSNKRRNFSIFEIVMSKLYELDYIITLASK